MNNKMNRFTRISKTLIYITLILISVSSFCFLGDQNTAYVIALIPVIIIILLIIFFMIEKKTREIRKNKKIQKYKKVEARIVAARFFVDMLVLQLQIKNNKQDYLTSLVIKRPDQYLRRAYLVGEILEVWVNPSNQHDVVTVNIYNDAPKNPADWVLLLIIAFNVSIFTIVFTVAYFFPEKQFHDMTIITASDKQENIWEIRFSSPKTIYIKIYDPLNEKKIKTIKDKKERKPDNSVVFFIGRQANNAVIIGSGTPPIFDVYNTETFEKLYDVKDFESAYTFLNNGIAKIDRLVLYNKFTREDGLRMTTNDGFIYYYNVNRDKFYNSEKELKSFLYSQDSIEISKQPYSYFLSYIPGSANKSQLYLIEPTSKEGQSEIIKIAGINNIDVDYYDQSDRWSEKHCKVSPLLPEEYFLEAKLLYFDSSMLVVGHLSSANKEATEIISGYHKSGKKLFEIPQKDYPNHTEMKEDNYTTGNFRKINTMRNHDKLYLFFEKYGALGIDVKSGKIVWKYES